MTAEAQEHAQASVSVVDAFTDPNLLGRSFGEDTREAWRAVLSGAFALPMSADRAALFKHLSGGRTAPQSRVRELWGVAGRRSDKTHTAAGVGVYMAAIGAELDGTLSRLTAGERGVVMILAVDRPQARVALSYVRGLLEDSPMLAPLVERQTAEGVTLKNGVSIEVATNSHRAVRGRTILCAILDECAFYRDESSASPDVEVYRALMPSLATTGGMLIGISSPYAKRGLLYDKWRKHYGKDGDVLVVQGSTQQFNPNIDTRIIEDAEAEDPEAARSEWHAQFRDDIAGFIDRETVEGAMRSSPLESPYDRQNRYAAFADPAGGGADEFTLSIGHVENKTTVIDCLRAQRGTPADIVAEYADILTAYGIRKVWLDRYAGSWPSDEFARHGIEAEQAKDARTGLYIDTLAALNSDRVELPPDNRMLQQFVGLERRKARSGRETVDHPPGGHDDRANAVAGLIAHLSAGKPKPKLSEWI